MIIRKKGGLLLLLLFIFFKCSFSQSSGHYYPVYDTAQDRPWLDSLKRIVKKGDVPYDKEYVYAYTLGYGKYWQKQFRFINTCVTLALYYEKLYDRKKIADMHFSVRYLKRLIEMNRFPDEGDYEKASAIRTTVYRKLADIYYTGKGVKKNLHYSKEMALQGVGHNKKFFDFYSDRYYHHRHVFLNEAQKFNYDTDTLFSFEINPFAWEAEQFDKKTLYKNIEPVAEAFIKRYKKEKLAMMVTAFPEASARDQSKAYNLLTGITKLFCEKKGMTCDLVSTNAEVQYMHSRGIEIAFTR